MCHDHDTGSELAVKQVEVGLLNSATQKVCDQNIFSCYTINTFSTRLVMRIWKIVCLVMEL